MGDFANWNNTPNQAPRREHTPYTKDKEQGRRMRIVIAILFAIAILLFLWLAFIVLKNEFSETGRPQLNQQQIESGQRLARSQPIGG